MKLNTNEYQINYPVQLEDFVKKSLKVATAKRGIYNKLFNCEDKDIGIIKCSFFISREEFESHIFSIANGKIPPKWASGCFYNDEIQVLVDVRCKEKRIFTLAHESLHIYFNKAVYRNFNVERVKWLDESYASYLDGHNDDKDFGYYNAVAERLVSAGTIDLNCNDERALYDMYTIIGKYIFDNNLEKILLFKLSKSPIALSNSGEELLRESLKYFKK